jgi:hypothetical protein
MRRLLTAAGVDYAQWKALTIVALKLDFRQMSFGANQWQGDRKGVSVLIGMGVFYLMFGFFMGAAVWFLPDLFLAGTMLITLVVFLVGTTILLEHNSALTSPTDYPVLAYRPVSSRTYFAARLTNVLVYTSAMTTVVAWLPIVALFVRHGPAVGVAGIAAVYVCTISVALGVLLVYATMLKLFGADALKRALSYVQLLLSFMVYGGYFVFARVFEESVPQSFTVEKTWPMLLFPGTWYASYLELAAGRIGAMEVIPAVASVVVLAVMAGGLSSRLSLDYSERLGALASSTRRPATASRSAGLGRLFRAGEARAVALLVRSQFRNDQRFRMAVLSILPLTILYVFMGISQGGLADPFDAEARQGPALVSLAVMLFPSMLKMAVSRTDSFRASWVFFACPADRVRLVRSTRDVLVAFFLVPYLFFVGAVYLYFVPNVLHVVVHLSLLGLMSLVVLQLVTLLDPDLPFSKPPMKGSTSVGMFLLIFVVFVTMIFFQILAPRLYRDPLLIAAAFGGVAAVIVVLDLITKARVEQQVRALEFTG